MIVKETSISIAAKQISALNKQAKPTIPFSAEIIVEHSITLSLSAPRSPVLEKLYRTLP